MTKPFIHGSLIGELCTETVAHLLQFVAELKNGDRFCLTVCSPGGDTFVYGAAVDVLRPLRDEGRLRTVALGQCCSGAPLIVAAGAERFSYRNCVWMLHEPFLAEVSPDPAAQKAEMEDIASTRDRYYNLLAEFSGRTRRYWQNRVAGQSMFRFDAKDAKRMGLVDEVI